MIKLWLTFSYCGCGLVDRFLGSDVFFVTFLYSILVSILLTRSQSQAIFRVSPNGRVVVAQPGLLDREAEPLYRLVLECSAGSEHAYTALVVEVQDANDHEPRFLQQRYASAVWEGKPPGTFVMQVPSSFFPFGGQS